MQKIDMEVICEVAVYSSYLLKTFLLGICCYHFKDVFTLKIMMTWAAANFKS